MRVIISGMQTGVLVAGDNAVTPYECVGDRILHTICCSRTMDLGLHIAVHARKKSLLRHTALQPPKLFLTTYIWGIISNSKSLGPEFPILTTGFLSGRKLLPRSYSILR